MEMNILFMLNSIMAMMFYWMITLSDSILVKVLCVIGIALYLMQVVIKIANIIDYLQDRAECKYYERKNKGATK